MRTAKSFIERGISYSIFLVTVVLVLIFSTVFFCLRALRWFWEITVALCRHQLEKIV